MKYLLTAALALMLFACGDTDVAATEVPAAVTTAFNTSYPGATDVEWEEDGDHYEVEFDYNGEELKVEYSATGEPLGVHED